MLMLEQLATGVSHNGALPLALAHQQLVKESPLGEVNLLATSAMQLAVAALQGLLTEQLSVQVQAQIDRTLIDHWCTNSVFPVGWQLPAAWDELAKDYRCADGWIRLHTNAPHHRQSAVAVLGGVTSTSEAAEAIASWQGQALETAIVEAGGCAAQLREAKQWQCHPQGQAVAQEPIVDWQMSQASLDTARMWRAKDAKRPLRGLKVLDLTRVIAGPVATRFLASLGADVLRIDPPFWTEHGKEIDLTVGKRCAGLDLRKAQDKVQLQRLMASADVLVHGYRQGALAGLGFDAVALRNINANLICVSLNAYGATGPWQFRRGFDSLVQRSAGLAVADEHKVYELPYQVLDHASGYLMAANVLQALRWQHNHQQTASAHVSLARQATLLDGVDTVALQQHRVDQSHGLQPYNKLLTPEMTGWGKARRLPMPVQIPGVDMFWQQPASKLRSALPAWR
ncbi:MAG TPA: acyl-CoA transferase [Oceanospirillaceae bacterium]|nr:acyl-CoA transferase [Oceanospirillaceae bacterium]